MLRRLTIAFDVASGMVYVAGALICLWTSWQHVGEREFWLWLAAAIALGHRVGQLADDALDRA